MRIAKHHLSRYPPTDYIRAVLHFTRFLGRSPDKATAADLRRYQLHRVDQGISTVRLNATITGLEFLIEATLGQPELMAKMHPVRMSGTLPIILSRELVSRLLDAAKTLSIRPRCRSGMGQDCASAK
jgi:integrase/recombinase XerD